jgi:hypothetical protein
MIHVIPASRTGNRSLSIEPDALCDHGRLVDEVFNNEGARTGQLMCLECRALVTDHSLQDDRPRIDRLV